eukprot:ANDGO_01984.mRNA.1 NADPH-dependent diflavin oxidoreductase 1
MSNRRVSILFGTQTGCSEEVAYQLARDAERRHFSTNVSSMNDFPFSALVTESLIVFVCSTTGQGDTPSSMKEFWRLLLRKSIPLDFLKNVNVAVFGLGDSSYAKFNAVARRLERRLLQVGACVIARVGLGDDQHPLGVDGDLAPWRNELWSAVDAIYPLPAGFSAISDNDLLPVRLGVSVQKGAHAAVGDGEEPRSRTERTRTQRDSTLCSLISNDRMTSGDHFQDVRWIKLDISESGLSFEPGDAVAVMPQNFKDDVDRLMKLFDLHSSDCLLIEQFSKSPIPAREVFSSWLDICGTPARYFFSVLSHFTLDELQRDRLQYFGSAEGNDDFYRYSRKERRTYVEVLEDFPTVKLPLERFVDLVPRLRPRYFSIASAQASQPHIMDLAVAVVQYKTPYKRSRRGLCSTFLATLTAGEQIEVWIEKGTVAMPPSHDTPLLMVGPGTGCAPFRAFSQARTVAKGSCANMCFYFGCRNKHSDYLFGSEWESFGFGHFRVAFSRDQESKVYVQHLIERDVQYIANLILDQGAYIYIAGNSKNMPEAVQSAIVECLVGSGKVPSLEVGQKLLRQMELQKRFLMETWS